MILVIPTAGLATRMQPVSCGLPKALVFHHDRPILQHILASYHHVPLTKIVIVIAPQDRSLFVPLVALYELVFTIELVVQLEPKGLLDAVMCASAELATDEPVLVHLSDSIFTHPFQQSDFKESFVAVSEVAEKDVRHWCMVDIEGEIARGFVDKPQVSKLRGAICGLYFFANKTAFDDAMTQIEQDQNALKTNNISSLLVLYGKKEPLYVKWRTDWWDMGTLAHMHSHRFHHVFDGHEVRQKDNQIIKSGHSEAIQSESFFYQHTPASHCFPRIDAICSHQITMQYVSNHSLAANFLWTAMRQENTDYIIEELWRWMDAQFYNHPLPDSKQSKQATYFMYGARIVERIDLWRSKLASHDQVKLFSPDLRINNRLVLGWPKIESFVLKRAKALAENADIVHIHGDLHCANILYDPERHLYTLIDPRGAWGKHQTIWGDRRYDMAKFLHSFHGGYEYIKNRLSLFQESVDGSYALHLPIARVDTARWLDTYCDRLSINKADVLWIEGLCLLAISRFYRDSALQKQFFLQGLLLLNTLL